jgi:hypothetical protein
MPVFLHQPAITGMNIATTGVLLRTALVAATGSITRSWPSRTERGTPRSRSVSCAMAPVSVRPAATTYSTATVRTPSLPKAPAR